MRKLLSGLLVLSVIAASACTNPAVQTSAGTETETSAEQVTPETYDLAAYASMTPEEICQTLTLEQKAAQMIEPTIYNTTAAGMKDTDYGSILSRIDNFPMPTAEEWRATVNEYQKYAIQADAPIPYVYGNDSLHGVNFASGCVMFPHNINIGAAHDAALTEEYGKLVGSDIVHTGMILNFSPCVATANDPRWGRTYESYSSDSTLVTEMAVAYSKGL